MAPRPDQPSRPSRRSVVTAGSTLLAGFGLTAALPGRSSAAGLAAEPAAGHAPAPVEGELALYRPVRVSSTAYAPTPAEFVVDKVTSAGVKGTGWRAADGDPQWVSVDLQALCEVTSVRLTFEAAEGDPVFVPEPTGNWSDGTTGKEILSSYATAFTVEVSTDGQSWTSIHRTTSGTGGTVDVAPPKPVRARWVRMTSTKRSSANPLGLNGFEVHGTGPAHRPAATGWTDWGRHDHRPPRLELTAEGTVPLESGWVLTMDDWADGTGADLSRPGVDTGGWLPAVVPGTVHGALVEQGKLPDPVAGFGNMHAPEALSRHSWWYKRDFELPHRLDTGRGRHVWLEFDGVNHEAEVWLNGRTAGTLTYPFARAAYDVTSLLARGGTQALAVKITPMPVPGSPADKGPAGESWVDAGAGQMNLNSPTYLASSGWDWMPAVRDRAAGIWNHVRLRSTGHAVLGDPRVDTVLPNLPDTSAAEVTVVVPVRNADSSDHEVTVTAAFGRVRLSTKVTVAAGRSTEVTFSPDDFPELKLHKPKLWWPNGYGEPHLHDLTLTASVSGRVSDHRTSRFGIRQFGYEYDVPLPFTASADRYTQPVALDSAADARYVRIKFGKRATDWGFSLWALSVVDSANPDTDLALHGTATASSSADGTDPAAVSDGDPSTRWTSAYEDDQWLQVDLGAPKSFDRVNVTWQEAYAKTYVVQTSADGRTWSDAKAVDNSVIPLPFNGGAASLRAESVPVTTARYVRLNCGLRNTSWGNSLWTFSVIDSSRPSTDLALHAKVSASTEDASHPAANATDGDAGTRWSSAEEDNQWITVDLGSRQRFDQVAVLWEAAYPKTYVIQSSDDDKDWTDLKTVDNTPESLKISVNGTRVLARGGNWGWDELIRRMPESRMDTAVRMHRDMNFTMIRNWVGSSNREEFFAKCDEYGLLVWNDFPNAWGMDPPDHTSYNAIAADTVLRYRIHPCVVVWCGANEGNPPQAIDDGMRQAVQSQAPGILYQNNSAGGIINGGGPYNWVEPDRYYDPSLYGSHSFGFHTEIGMPVVSTAESMRNLIGDGQPDWPIGGSWYYHDWSEHGNQAPQQYVAAIEARLGRATGLDDLVRKAQFVNFENSRAMFEAWNSRMWDDAGGLMLWMSHPAWHSTVWQTYDYDFDVNGFYYGARSACERHHVQADPATGRVIALNHTPDTLEDAVVTAEVYGLDGKRQGGTRRTRLDVASSTAAEAFEVPFDENLPDLHLLRLTLTSSHGTVLSRNVYWRYRDPSDMKALNSLRKTKLSLSLRRAHPSGSRQQTTAVLRNSGSRVAAMVRLSLLDERGERVLPAEYGDNYVWLLPGESRTVTVSWPSFALRPGHRPVLRAQGYNTAAVSAKG
ncbi:discoidin domain-containing protein [Streptomyces tendae]|uniref:discoidin domain-containing protein n=1 Tax=Streptomyces tendae TaxID=1932 RepID=UPI002490C4E7|nr:discoidin domain-containing protein [Streptomyces tendae]